MENQNFPPELKSFGGKILITEVGIFLVGGVISYVLKLHFGLVLFGLGLLITGVGAYLGNPNQNDPRNPKFSRNPYEWPTAERLRARILFFAKNSVPFYSIENVILIAGIIALLSSMLILFI